MSGHLMFLIKHVKVNHVTNNMTESFNVWLEKSSQLPILTLLMYKKKGGRFEKGNAWESEISSAARKQ